MTVKKNEKVKTEARALHRTRSLLEQAGHGIDTMRPHQAVRLREWLGLLDAEENNVRFEYAGPVDRKSVV